MYQLHNKTDTETSNTFCGISQISTNYGLTSYQLTQTLLECKTIFQAVSICEDITTNNITNLLSTTDATIINGDSIDWCFISLTSSQTHFVQVTGSNSISLSSASLNNKQITFESNLEDITDINKMPVITVNTSIFSGDDSDPYSFFTISDYIGIISLTGIKLDGSFTELSVVL